MIKFLLALALILGFVLPASAESVQLYASVDDSNSTVNLLGDVMRNDPAYDPYNQFAILRAGERDYRVYFGKDISKSSICYTYTPSSYNVQASIDRRVVSSGLNISKQGYWFVGNIDGSLASASVDNYNSNYVLGVVFMVVAVFVIFKMFRRHKSVSSSRYYSVR